MDGHERTSLHAERFVYLVSLPFAGPGERVRLSACSSCAHGADGGAGAQYRRLQEKGLAGQWSDDEEDGDEEDEAEGRVPTRVRAPPAGSM